MAHKFNGIDVRTPTSFNWELSDIETGNTYRDGDGNTRYYILTQKRSISYEWLDPTAEEVSFILQLVNQKDFVSITYPDALSGTYETRAFRPLKKSAPFRNFRVGAKLYSRLAFEFEEL